MQIVLTPELEQMIQSHVDSGVYDNANDVVCDALNKLFDNNDEHYDEEAWELLKNMLLERVAEAKTKGLSTRTVDQIVEDTLAKIDNL